MKKALIVIACIAIAVIAVYAFSIHCNSELIKAAKEATWLKNLY